MLKKVCYILLCLGMFACQEKPAPKKSRTLSKPTKPFDSQLHLLKYHRYINDITKEKNYYRNTKDLNRVQKVTYSIIADSIFPYWYGTAWDFNGITQEPRKGSVACGYFVTTTLRDAGFPIDRSTLGQQPSSVLIQKLCTDIHKFNTIPELEDYFKTQPEKTLFLLGLDTHIGFVIKENNQLYFIHSSYSGDKQVKKEALQNSIPVKKSKVLIVGNFSGNATMMKRWLGLW